MNREVILKPEDLAAIAREEISRILNEWGLPKVLSAIMQALLEHDPDWRAGENGVKMFYTFYELTAAMIIAGGDEVEIRLIDLWIHVLLFYEVSKAGRKKVSVFKRLVESVGSETVLSAIADWVSNPEHSLGGKVTLDESRRALVVGRIRMAEIWDSSVGPVIGAIAMRMSHDEG